MTRPLFILLSFFLSPAAFAVTPKFEEQTIDPAIEIG